MKHTRFQVQQLRSRNVVTLLMSLVIFVATLFTVAILPSILIRYVYAGQQLFENPPLLDYIPLVGFTVSALYFIYAVIMVARREMMASRYEKQVTTSCMCGYGDCMADDDDLMVSDDELAELEKIVEDAMKTSPAKKSRTASKSKASRSKKSARSSTKKK